VLVLLIILLNSHMVVIVGGEQIGIVERSWQKKIAPCVIQAESLCDLNS